MGASHDTSILQLGQSRIFMQEAATPSQVYKYRGTVNLDGLTEPLGDVTPVYIPSSTQRNRWDIVDEVPGTPGLPTTGFTAKMLKSLRDIWWDLKERGCRFNVQIVIGDCQRPDNFADWESKILFAGARLTEFTLPSFNPLSGDDNATGDITGSLTGRALERILRIRFQQYAEDEVVAEVLDGLYYDTIQCGECGVASDGCRHVYFLTLANGGSPGLSSQIVYSIDDKATWATLDIPTLGGLSGNRMGAMGSRLVVVSEAAGSHHHILVTDADAGNTLGWVEVATGYEVTGSPRCIYVRSSELAFIGGAGGFIYKLTDPTSGVTVVSDNSLTTQRANDIGGYQDTVVSVHNNNVVLVSINGGDTFTAQTGPEVGVALNAVAVIGESTWFIGTANGHLYYTEDGGTSYTQITLDSAVTIINRIKFWDSNVGYMSVQAGASARVYRTDSCGNRWDYQNPSISGLPTVERINVVIPCGYNEVAAGGRVESAGDGVIAIAG